MLYNLRTVSHVLPHNFKPSLEINPNPSTCIFVSDAIEKLMLFSHLLISKNFQHFERYYFTYLS